MSIQVQAVSKGFGDFTALENVSLEVPDGSLTALLGPSGGGKSTLLRVIAGLEEPDAGRVHISGEDATATPARKRGVGFVFQHYAAFKHMTVRDNVAFGLKIRKRPKDEIKAKVDELLGLVHLVVQAAQPGAELLAHGGVERAERLVEEQHLRLLEKRLGDGEPLLHAA